MSEQPRLLEARQGVSFVECLERCLHSDLWYEWQRLTGKRLATTGIDRLIDEATGYDLAVMHEFADFVYHYVFCFL